MYSNTRLFIQFFAAAGFMIAAGVNAQTSAPAPAPATDSAAQTPAPPAAAAPTPAPAPLKFPWKVGPMAVTGFIDGSYSYNGNQPTDGAFNQLYNFDDKADNVELSAAKLTLNHDPAPFGAHFDFIYGRTNGLVNAGLQGNYIEQAYLSLKPAKAKGFEMDFGKWVTSAGAEVIEAKDNWDYSRSLLFSWAIPYDHFGLRTSMPVSKVETIGVQVVNGWNTLTKNQGIATVGLTSALVKPKYTWNVNVYTGPEHFPGPGGYRNLVDTTLLLTPNAKFNAYVNYDYGQNRDRIVNGVGDTKVNSWEGIAFSAHQQINAIHAVAARYEYFNDPDGYSTGLAQHLNEITGTYEFKFPKLTQTVLSRFEYRRDMSNQPFFKQDVTGLLDHQSTFTIGLIAVFAPHQ
jgi:hypothetical protein